MPAHVEVTIKIPVDCDPVTAQRINQICRAVMAQFPGIDDGPQHPFRMFLTTMDTFADKLDGTEPPTVVEAQEEDISPDRAEKIGRMDGAVKDMAFDYVQHWGSPAVDRAEILRKYMVGETANDIQVALSAHHKNPTKYLVDLGLTAEQASNLLAVGTAMQLIRI